MDWKSVVKSIAPTIGAALGGPMGGAATKFLADKFLGDGEADQKSLETAILGAHPDQLVKLRELDNEFKLSMQRIGVDVFALEVQDRESARDLAKKTNLGPQVALSLLFIGGYFALLYMLFSGTVSLPDNLRDMCTIMLGVMTGEVPRIMSFWFGSSQGSKDKTAKLSEKR